MELWQYSAVFALVAIAPIVGMLLARAAPDERKLGEKWFVLFRYTLIAIIGGLLLWSARLSAIAATGTVMGVLLFLATREFPRLHHALVGVAYWHAAASPLFLALALALVLLGMVGGTLAVTPKALKQRLFWNAQLRSFCRVAWPVLMALPLYAL